MSRIGALAVAAACAAWFGADVLSAQCLEEVGGLYSGPAVAVDLDGDLAVFARGPTLVVVDLTDRTQARELGSVVLPGVVRGLALAGRVAFAACGEAGGQVVSLGDLTAPVVIGSLGGPPADQPVVVFDVAAQGSLAFVAERTPADTFLRVVDVSDPAHAVTLGMLDTEGQRPFAIVATGDLVLLSDDYHGISMIDVSSPSEPVLLSQWGFQFLDVTAVGSIVFAVGRYGVEVFSIADPEHPQLVSRFADDVAGSGISVVGSLVLIAAGQDGLRVWEMDDLWNQHEIAVFDALGPANGVVARAGLALVAAGVGGLAVVDLDDPAQPAELGRIAARGTAGWIAASDDLALLDNGWRNGPSVLDLSDPGHPLEVAVLPPPQWAGYIAAIVHDRLACVAAPHRLVVFDLSDPAAPQEIGAVERWWDGEPLAMARAGTLIFVVGTRQRDLPYSPQVLVVDVADPWSPVSWSWLLPSLNGRADSIAIEGNRAYIGQDNDNPWGDPSLDSLRIYDISNRLEPVELGEGGFALHGLVVRDSHAYLLAGDLEVVDCRNPASMELVGSLDVAAPPVLAQAQSGLNAVITSGVYDDYFGMQSSQVHLVDLADPRHPSLVASAGTRDLARDVAVSGGYAFVADGDAGLAVFDISGCTAPAPRRPAGRQ